MLTLSSNYIQVGKNNCGLQEKDYYCVRYFADHSNIDTELAILHPWFYRREDFEYEKWVQAVEKKCSIQLKLIQGQYWWDIKGWSYPQLHLAVVLARLPMEIGKSSLFYVNLMKLGSDPLRVALAMEGASPNPGHSFPSLFHGAIKPVLDKFDTTKAFQDLKESNLMINAAWSKNVRIGMV